MADEDDLNNDIYQNISLNVDFRLRSQQYFHVSANVAEPHSYGGKTFHENLIFQLARILQNPKLGISSEIQKTLLDYSKDMNLEHINLEMLSVALYICYDMLNRHLQNTKSDFRLSPQIYTSYYNHFAPYFLSDTKIKEDDIPTLNIKYKTELLTYLIKVMDDIPAFNVIRPKIYISFESDTPKQ